MLRTSPTPLSRKELLSELLKIDQTIWKIFEEKIEEKKMLIRLYLCATSEFNLLSLLAGFAFLSCNIGLLVLGFAWLALFCMPVLGAGE